MQMRRRYSQAREEVLWWPLGVVPSWRPEPLGIHSSQSLILQNGISGMQKLLVNRIKHREQNRSWPCDRKIPHRDRRGADHSVTLNSKWSIFHRVVPLLSQDDEIFCFDTERPACGEQGSCSTWQLRVRGGTLVSHADAQCGNVVRQFSLQHTVHLKGLLRFRETPDTTETGSTFPC